MFKDFLVSCCILLCCSSVFGINPNKSYSYTKACEKCQQAYEECKNRKSLFKNCVDCDKVCSEAQREQSGLSTEADRNANDQLNSTLSSAQFHASFTKTQKDVYTCIKDAMESYIPTFQQTCYNEYAFMLGQGLNDNYTVNSCVADKMYTLSLREGAAYALLEVFNKKGIKTTYAFIRKCMIDVAGNLNSDYMANGSYRTFNGGY